MKLKIDSHFVKRGLIYLRVNIVYCRDFTWQDVGSYQIRIENDYGSATQDIYVDMAGKCSHQTDYRH